MQTTHLFERITRQIIAAVEAGVGTYQLPWHRWGTGTSQPINAISSRSYRGINTLLLWAAAEAAGYSSGRWATYRQWAEAGGQVRKGEKSTFILFWKSAANDQPEADESEKDGPGRPRIIGRVYSVFNAEQVEGVEPAATRPMLSPEERVEAAESFVAATGAQVRHGGDRACYVANIDQIWLPQFEQFRDAESYYSVLAHECVHWSGAKHRLNRDLSGRFGTDSYAMEELVAELGSAFIAGHLGLTIEPRPDHACYISSWLRVLSGDPRALLTAAAKAQEAADYLIACSSAGAAHPGSSPVPALAQIG
jgi:antirestriction protein ArdC